MSDILSLPRLFLLCAANRAFILGETRRIEPPGAWDEGAFHHLAKTALRLGQFLCAGALFAVAIVSLMNWFRMEFRSEMTEGTVTARWTEERKTESRATTTDYYFQYQFTPVEQNDHAYSGRARVDRATYAQSDLGARVTVSYLLSDPETSTVEGAVETNNPLAMAFLGVISGGLLLGMIRHDYRRYKLRHHGQVVPGQLTYWHDSRKTGMAQVKYWHVDVRYCFTDAAGETIEGAKGFNTNDPLWLVGEAGMSVAVVYVNKHLHELL